ncbi:MAG: CoA transferase [Deltaproteobacteria bacterium]|nr:CoA transferase [Deltaproteobacteria bacterium]
MEQALSGFRVLDFGHYIAGPYAAMLLAEQGAEVIKVERPGGDPFRYDHGFVVWNRSKKGITLDLKKEEGQKVAQELAKTTDVIIENFRPGVADRLGIGFESLRQVNPRLIYCSISGFGQEGPYRDLPGWGPMVGALSGATLEQGGGQEYPPLYLVLYLPSYYSAFMASLSIASALLAREITGKGQRVDISLFSSMLGAQATAMVDFEDRIRLPWTNPQGSMPLYKFYQGSDGKWFFLGLGNMGFFTKFAVALGREEWLADPRFEGAPFLIFPPVSLEIIAEFKEMFATKTRDEWLKFLQSEDIPCAAARPVEEFLDDPQVMANEMVVEIEESDLGKVREMGFPVKLKLTPGEIKGRSPKPGEHTEETLAKLIGYSAEDIAGLKERGIV